jgi:hypothetical protein
MNSRHFSTRIVGSIRKFLFPLALSMVGITLVSSAGAQSFQTSLTEQEFTLAPGASHSLVIPVAYIPVHITVS